MDQRNVIEITNQETLSLSKTGSKAVELLLGISVVQRMSFCVNKKFYGGIILFMTKSVLKSGLVTTESELAIEILANMASSQIQRLRD